MLVDSVNGIDYFKRRTQLYSVRIQYTKSYTGVLWTSEVISELLDNLEEMLSRYHMDSDVISRFKSLTTHWRVTRCEKVLFTLINLHILNIKHI